MNDVKTILNEDKTVSVIQGVNSCIRMATQ